MSAELIDQANELAELQREAAIAKLPHQPCGSFGHSLPRLRGRDTRAAPGTGGGLPALR
nr:hypothetical protein [Klebsiella pneumoniae]